jgi:hypothetical protein
MTTLNWLATASLASALLPSLYAETHCPGNVASIRPRFVERSIVIVPVILNGSGPYDFVLDTAQQMTTIDPRVASELRLKLQGSAGVTGAGFSTRASYAQSESLQTGGHVQKNLLLLVHPLGQIQVSDPRVRGILGQNFLERFDLLIDYAYGIVCLDDTKQLQVRVKGARIPLASAGHPEHNLPFTQPLIIPVRVDRSIGGGVLRLQLDSGSNTPLLFDAKKLHPAVFASATLRSKGTDGAIHAYAVLAPQDIHVGLHSLRQVSFAAPIAAGKDIPSPEIDGVLPTALFQRVFISSADHFAVLEPW